MTNCHAWKVKVKETVSNRNPSSGSYMPDELASSLKVRDTVDDDDDDECVMYAQNWRVTIIVCRT